MDGRISVSMTFAAEQRNEIGRHEVNWVGSLPGFDIGVINDDFYIARI